MVLIAIMFFSPMAPRSFIVTWEEEASELVQIVLLMIAAANDWVILVILSVAACDLLSPPTKQFYAPHHIKF